MTEKRVLRLVINGVGDLELNLGSTLLLTCQTGTYAASRDGKWSVDSRYKIIMVSGPSIFDSYEVSKLDLGIKRNIIFNGNYNVTNSLGWSTGLSLLCCCIGCCMIFK